MRVHGVRDLASALRGRRIEAGLSQAELARRARVSRKWIHDFERGKPTAELSLVLRALEALGLVLDVGPLSDDDARLVAGAPPVDPGAPHERRIDLDRLLDEYSTGG